MVSESPLSSTNRVRYLVIILGFGAVYLLTRSRVASIDALYYFRDMTSAWGGHFLHPHHLLYEPAVKLWCEMWWALGYGGAADSLVKSFSLIGSLGALIAFARCAVLLVGRGFLGWVFLLCFGFSYLPWHYASQGEPVAFFLCFSCLNLYLLLDLLGRTEATPGSVRWLGLANVFGVLVHQALIFVIPISAVVIWFRTPPGSRSGRVALFLVICLGAVLLLYGLGALVALDRVDPVRFLAWSTGYLEEFAGVYGRADLIFSTAALRGLTLAFLSGNALKAYFFEGAIPGTGYWLALVPIGVLAVFLVWGLVLALIFARTAGGERRRQLLLLLAFAAVFGAAAIWWEPGNRKFWAPVVPCLLLLAGLGWGQRPQTRAGRLGVVSRLVPLVVVCGLLAGNLLGGILPKHRRSDEQQPLLTNLRQMYREGDVVILREDRLWLCVDYHCPQMTVFGVPPPRSDRYDPEQSILAAAGEAAAVALGSGSRVFITSELAPEVQTRLAVLLPETAPQVEQRQLFEFADPEAPNKRQTLGELVLP